MAVKTFTTEVLTSADTNTYLANSGLVYITSTTIGTGVSSVTLSSVFSATYDNYRVIYQIGDANTINALNITFNNSTGATYSHGGAHVLYGVATVVAETSNTGLTSSAYVAIPLDLNVATTKLSYSV